MDSINSPVGDDPKDPYERYRVEAIEKDRIAKEEFAKKREAAQERSSFLVAYLNLVYRRIIELFQAKTERGVSPSVEATTRRNLLLFKDCLQMLRAQDLSQDIAYLNRLSEIWMAVLEDSLRFRKASAFALQFRALLRDLQNYPAGEEHSLGYYLSEYAGQTWLPFPYMELMLDVHDDPDALARWCLAIDELTGLLNPE